MKYSRLSALFYVPLVEDTWHQSGTAPTSLTLFVSTKTRLNSIGAVNMNHAQETYLQVFHIFT